ncbi:MAG: MarR family winged helix-turn-helix transcriptional regulator [Erysipelotrichaceae bacterium]
MSNTNTCAMLFKQIHSELEKNANNTLRKDGLTMSQIRVLMSLSKAEGNQIEQKKLEQSMHIAQSTATGIVKRLQQKGFIEGFTSENDKRIKMIRITPKGMGCFQKAEQNMKKVEAVLTSVLTDTENDILISLLQKIRNSF